MLRLWSLSINIESYSKNLPLYEALVQEIQRLIDSGMLQPGEALPSSRELAKKLGISRKTVVTAMDKLTSGGLLEHRARVGLFVSPHRYPASATQEAASTESKPADDVPATLPRLVIDDGLPDVSLMPATELSRAYRMHFNRLARRHQLDYFDPQGYQPLRHAISQAMCHSRGICVGPDNVLISRGGQHAIYLATHALLKPGDAIAVESMTRPSLLDTMRSAGLRIIEIPVDHDGLVVSALAEALAHNPDIRAIYVTPRAHFPTTAQLSQRRRLQLTELVLRHDLLAIEDDFDSFVSLSNSNPEPLSTSLLKGHFFYICTSTRILAPIIRMGFVATSSQDIQRITAYRQLIDVQGDVVMERAMAELIETGEVRRCIRQSNQVYNERFDYLHQRIRHDLGNRVIFQRPNAGLAVWLELRNNPTPSLQARGISVPVQTLSNGRYGMRIGYATLSKDDADLLIEALKE